MVSKCNAKKKVLYFQGATILLITGNAHFTKYHKIFFKYYKNIDAILESLSHNSVPTAFSNWVPGKKLRATHFSHILSSVPPLQGGFPQV